MPDGELSGKRVAIVCANFSPEVGYQEVDLAAAFVRIGAQVRVITTTRASASARRIVGGDYAPGRTVAGRLEVVRLVPRLTLGPNVLGCDTRPAIEDFAPTHVIVVGPGKLFGLELFATRSRAWQRIAIVQDHSEDGRSSAARSWRTLAKRAGHLAIKRPAYRLVVRGADRVVLNVPETRSVIRPWLAPRGRRRLEATGLDLRLGFDPEVFFLDRDARSNWRSAHAVADSDCLIGTCTRATPEKRLENVIRTVTRLRQTGLPVRYALVGLLGDEYAKTLSQLVADQPEPDAFILLPATDQPGLRAAFSSFDIGLWSRAAITIQQAMGTGLPVVLPQHRSVSHLLDGGGRGWYYPLAEGAEKVLATAVGEVVAGSPEDRLAEREANAAVNRDYLSYDTVARQIIARLG
jgi:glycosyltransferase involved in cell wall biosynthesis